MAGGSAILILGLLTSASPREPQLAPRPVSHWPGTVGAWHASIRCTVMHFQLQALYTDLMEEPGAQGLLGAGQPSLSLHLILFFSSLSLCLSVLLSPLPLPGAAEPHARVPHALRLHL